MAKNKSAKLTKSEKSWVMYDWANSVYATNIMAAIFPIYFAAVCKADNVPGDVWWGYGTSIATAVIAILAPMLGAIGDYKGMKKKLLTFFMLLGVIFTSVMAIGDNWKLMLVGYVISYIGFAGSCLFYDSFLTDVTTEDRMDKVSAWGYAMGYIGGSTIPFLISIAVLLVMGMDNPVAVKISVIITSVWWLVFSIPMLKNVKQVHYIERGDHAVRQIFSNMASTFRGIFRDKSILIFIVAYFFYIDGVNTVIHMATSYGSTIGLGTTGMILALLVTQIVAVPCSIIFSKLADKVGSTKMIGSAIAIYILICCVGFYMGYSMEQQEKPYVDHLRTVAAEAIDEQRDSFTVELAIDAYDRTVGTAEDAENSELFSLVKASISSEAPAETFTESANELIENTAASPAIINSMNAIRDKLAEALADNDVRAPYADAISFSTILFWAMATLVGTVQGGIQALSRSYYGKIIPPERSNEYFGFYDIFGKFACVIGPALYAFVRDTTGRPSLGILSLIVLFAIGGLTLLFGRKHLRRDSSKPNEAAE